MDHLSAQCDDEGSINSLACNCPGEIISRAGVYISDIGVHSGSDADGLPNNDFTHIISNRDVLTLGYDLGPEDVSGEICGAVASNNRRGAVSITRDNQTLLIRNPNGDYYRTPQTVCFPIEGQGVQEVEFRDSGFGNLIVDGSELSYCLPEPQGSIVPDFEEPLIRKTGDIPWPALETLADQVADPDMDISDIIQSDFVYHQDLRFSAAFRPSGKSRREICRLPPLKMNLKKSVLENFNFIRDHNKMKIVFQCQSTPRYAETIKMEKFLYDLYGLVSPNGFRSKLIKIRLEGYDCLVDGFVIESDDDIQSRLNLEMVKTGTISTDVVDRSEYVRMCLFQYLISNADWSARKGHNTNLFKRNVDNSLVIIPYDFDFSGIIDNVYAVPHEQLPSATSWIIRSRWRSYRKVRDTISRGSKSFFS